MEVFIRLMAKPSQISSRLDQRTVTVYVAFLIDPFFFLYCFRNATGARAPLISSKSADDAIVMKIIYATRFKQE